jgi:phospholipid/cholesterol/gamma-HCH transport system permease protein
MNQMKKILDPKSISRPIEQQKDKESVFTNKIDTFFIDIYSGLKFLSDFFRAVFTPPYEPREIIRRCYDVGYNSLALISLNAFITGIVFTKQSRPSLADFGATSWLPSLVGIAILKALAPLLTALICAGKLGSNIGAELGSMRVTQQIDAMEMSAADPFKFLVVTRVIATTVMIPILTMYMALIALLGSYLNVHVNEQTTMIAFFQNALSTITFHDYTTTLVRAVIYGFTIGMVSCYKGFNAGHGTAGVGKAATASVVLSMFLIFIEEIIIVQVINWMRHV